MPCVAGAAVPCRPSHGLPLLVQVLAAVTALSTEAIAKGVLNVPEEDEDESQREAMDWTAVAQGTGLNFARESTALILIDMQVDFLHRAGRLGRHYDASRHAALAKATAQVERLLAAARKAGLTIAHSRSHRLGELVDEFMGWLPYKGWLPY